MLNRTNLTLSALSNRLNLGTRSLALNASVNHGGQILCIRHLHHDVMRDTMVWYVVSPFAPGKYDIPLIPGSTIPGQQQRPVVCAGQEASRSVCPPSVEPSPSQTWFLSQEFLGQGSRGSRSASPAPARPGTARAQPRPHVADGRERGFGSGTRREASSSSVGAGRESESGRHRRLSPDRRVQHRGCGFSDSGRTFRAPTTAHAH